MKKKVLLLALLGVQLTATTVCAQVRGGAFTASLFEGGYTFDGAQHLKTDVAHGARLGYNLTRNLGVEGQLTYVSLKSTSATVRKEGEQYGLSANLLYNFLPENRLVPYLLLGGGWTKMTNFFSDNEDGTFDYGGGVRYALNDWVELRGDVRHILSFHTAAYGNGNYWSNFEYTAGLTFQLGGTAAKPAAATVALRQDLAREQAAREVLAAGKATLPVSPPPPVASVPAAVVTPADPLPAAAPPLPLAGEVSGDNNLCQVNSACNVTIEPDGVKISSDLGIEKYKVFKLFQPTRLVIDIYCASNAGGSRTMNLTADRMGISTVRVGTHPGKLRVVVDTPLAGFPDYQLLKAERGLKLLLGK